MNSRIKSRFLCVCFCFCGVFVSHCLHSLTVIKCHIHLAYGYKMILIFNCRSTCLTESFVSWYIFMFTQFNKNIMRGPHFGQYIFWQITWQCSWKVFFIVSGQQIVNSSWQDGIYFLGPPRKLLHKKMLHILNFYVMIILLKVSTT